MPLKVAGVEIVNSTANVQVSTLPDTGIVTQEFGNTTFSITANVTNRGLVNSISTAEINKTSRNFELTQTMILLTSYMSVQVHHPVVQTETFGTRHLTKGSGK